MRNLKADNQVGDSLFGSRWAILFLSASSPALHVYINSLLTRYSRTLECRCVHLVQVLPTFWAVSKVRLNSIGLWSLLSI